MSVTTPEHYLRIVKTINKELPLHSMWDGFWIQSYKHKTLVVSCSFDRIYYRDFDIVFKKVIFYNLPERWRDTNIIGDDLLRIADKEEFERQQPGFDTRGLPIFAIDMHFTINDILEKSTFFVVAEHVYLNKCEAGNNNPAPEYEDPLAEEDWLSKRNRVVSN